MTSHLEPWMYELYARLKNNPSLRLNDDYEYTRLFVIDFEKAFSKYPEWFKFYLEAKAEGHSNAHIANVLMISHKQLTRRLENITI